MRVSDEVLASAFRSVLQPKSATYIASPITGGRRFFEWRKRYPDRTPTSADETFRREVIEANRAASARVAASVRAALRQVAIDPSQLHDVEGWTQAEYRAFWRHIILEFCHSIVLMDGWELSIGCVSEFAVAAHLGLKILRQDLTPLSAADGFRSIHEAMAQIEREGFSASDVRPDLDSAMEVARVFALRR